jgi:hypothetical protein
MTIQGLDIAQNTIGEFKFHEFHMLREFHLRVMPGDEYTNISVGMCLEAELRQPAARICLRFLQVSSLDISELSGQARIQGFNIADFSDRQLEDINWHVCDFEDQVISFYAKSAEITSASVIGRTAGQ